ncbi:uncharacterized protein EDB93DRAFT_1103554 [Suillus bovinus]|uniref:uncharacterized protein n=1 Tax=Suillus bovinus TaxID=48563 RepID=UPI001B860EF6|nr:uncharacterized protein EDB93DRAFT_1103554 [Suillus bovinus]KAG2150336.1 hypothetical protein EDB93DRAFT_1103554 [Suillus bovinus]
MSLNLKCKPHDKPTAYPTHPQQVAADQLSSIEVDLMQSVNDLKACNHIFGQLPTLEELFDPTEEREVGEYPAFELEGGDKAIADERPHQSHGQIFSICAGNSKLDACNMVIHSFHSTYHHNFVNFMLNYNEKKYLMLDRPL